MWRDNYKYMCNTYILHISLSKNAFSLLLSDCRQRFSLTKNSFPKYSCLVNIVYNHFQLKNFAIF